MIDDNPIIISKESFDIESIKDRLFIYHKGESFKLDDILEGKFSGRTIALGDTISVLIKIDAESLKILTKGKHEFKIESELVSNLIINFELDDENINIKFNPDKA
ncbi:MAG: hypothetical protein ACFFA0_15845 [Promethearchaeota archaeon]